MSAQKLQPSDATERGPKTSAGATGTSRSEEGHGSLENQQSAEERTAQKHRPEHVKTRPTRRFWLLALITLLVFGAAWTAQSGWMVIVAAALLGVLGASWIPARHGALSVRVDRNSPAFAEMGDVVEVTLKAVNRSRRTVYFVEVNDHLLGSGRMWIPSLGPGQSAAGSYRLNCSRRGKFQAAEITVRCAAPFGLISVSRRYRADAGLTVFPKIVPVPTLPLAHAPAEPREPARTVRRSANGEPVSVREYRPGDQRRAVHWRMSARTGKLVVREFAEEGDASIQIAIASGPVSNAADDAAFERLVSAAASISVRALQGGRQLGVTFGDDGPDGLLMESHRLAVLDWMAQLEASSKPNLLKATQLLIEHRQVSTGTTLIMGVGSRELEPELKAACESVRNAGGSPIAVLSLPGWKPAGSPGKPAVSTPSPGVSTPSPGTAGDNGASKPEVLQTAGAPTFLIDPRRPLSLCLASFWNGSSA